MSVHGRLGKTGVGPFDESYFLSFDALADIVSFCRTSDAREPQAGRGRTPTVRCRPVAAMSHADVCSPDLALDRVSAFLLQLAPGTQAGRRQVRARRSFPTSRSSRATPCSPPRGRR